MEIISLASLGTAALTEGVKFLYAQLTDILRRRREGKKGEEPSREPAQHKILDGTLDEGSLQTEKLAALENEVREARKALADYVDGVSDVHSESEALLSAVAQARHLLEQLYGQHVTFRGETGRPQTGTTVTMDQHAEGASRVINVSGTGSIAIGGNNSGVAQTTVHKP